MITIDVLINEGKTFKIKIREEYLTLEAGIAVHHAPTEYIDNGDEYIAWLEKCKRYIHANHPQDRAISDFEEASSDISKKNLYRLIGILEALKEIPTICTKKSIDTMGGNTININQNQYQTQTQSQSFELFKDAIKDHLTMGQFQELQKIANETPNIEEAKPKIIDKLKSFGEGVLTSILTNIITNPTIWSGLF